MANNNDQDEEQNEDQGQEEGETNNKGLGGIFTQFNKPFWIVNAFELFERGAYYGTMSVLGVHVTYYLLENNPTAAAMWGVLYAMLIILLYFIPLASAALALKYGYKNVLFVCYGLMLIGYFSLSAVQPGQFGFLVFSFLMIGIGAGAFKPIISSTIAHVTGERQRNLAYSVYYWMINLGATLVPLSIGLYTYFTYGVADENVLAGMGIYYFVGALSGILVIINTLILIFLFRNPVEPDKDLSIGNALMRIAPAFKDKKFVISLIIYSGFWFMFAYNHTFLPVLMVDFGRMPDWFKLAFLATINPGTIIILGPFLGKMVEKYKSLNVMMVGISIFCIGLAINGFSKSSELFIIGIIVFSIGEFITHPGFISYVSKISPKDKIPIYMGAIFISTGLGNAAGGVVHGFWYNYFARTLFMPQIYVSLVIAVGLITLICFIFYNRWVIRELLVKDPTVKVDTGIWTKPVTAGIALLFIPLTIWGAYLGGTHVYVGEEEVLVEKADWAKDYAAVPGPYSYSITGSSSENSDTDINIDITTDENNKEIINIHTVIFTLTWEDEPESNPIIYTNQPDTFFLSVQVPGINETLSSDEFSNPNNGQGTISFEVNIFSKFQPKFDPYYNGTGEYVVTIHCLECGDETIVEGGPGLLDRPDNGNDWALEIGYRYLLKRE